MKEFGPEEDSFSFALAEFDNTLQRYSEQPPAGDRVIGAMSRALSELLEADTSVQDLFTGIISTRLKRNNELDFTYLANLTVRSVQNAVLSCDYEDYPRAFKNVDIWRNELPDILKSRGRASESQFLADMLLREINSNLSERYKTVQWLGHLSLDGSMTMLDIGCSQNHGLVHLSSVDKLPFGDVTANVTVDDEVTTDEEITRKLNMLSHTPLNVEDGWGFDVWPIYDEALRDWVRSSSFRPEELEDETAVKRYEMLSNARGLTNIHSLHSRYYTDPEIIEQILPDKQFDIVTMLTLLYQLSLDDRRAMHEIARDHVAPGGLLLIQDGVSIPDTENFALDEVEFDSEYFNAPDNYVALVSVDDSAGAFQELGRFDSGRCREFTFSESEVALEAVHKLRSLPA